MIGATAVRIEWEWLPAPTVRAPELRTTWARLEIHVGRECVTLVEDQESKSSRRAIYCPLYPLAEWIAYNWWFLRADSRPASAAVHIGGPRLQSPEYQRHNFRGAGDGFLWPDMLVVPQGTTTQFAWTADPADDRAPVRFLSSGQAFVETELTALKLTDFVESVLARLHEVGLKETPLETEWRAIQSTDDGETAFCMAAARLGLDPYQEARDYEDDILRAAATLSVDLFDDFVDAVEPWSINSSLEWIKSAREAIESMTAPTPTSFSSLDMDGDRTTWGTLRPWELGWEQARQVRDAIGIGPDDAFEIEDRLAVTARSNRGRGFQAFGSRDSGTGPSVVLSRPSLDNTKRFTLARAAWHIIWGSSKDFLVTSAYTDKQKIERAFAAELLAPAAGVAERMESYPSTVELDEIEETADHFGVSPMIVEHQIRNQLAAGW